MKKTIMNVAVAILSLGIFVAGCGKTGAPGATGATGPAGPQGPAGPSHVFVDTFSIVNSQWLYNSAWVYSSGNGAYTEYFTRYYDATFSKVTQGVLDTGLVLVYIAPNQLDVNQWVPMPYVFLSFGAQYYINIAYETMPGKVRFHYWYTANGSATPPTTLSTDVIATHKYKIVAVASSTISTDMKRDKVDADDYGQVMKYLGY